MDRFRQKQKKDKPTSQQQVEKEKFPLIIRDVKSLKENLKIKEILRTVKMNSSMRIKAPRGSKVMNNKDFIDNDDFSEDVTNYEHPVQPSCEPPSATNPDVVLTTEEIMYNDENEAINNHIDNKDNGTNTEIDNQEPSKNIDSEADTNQTNFQLERAVQSVEYDHENVLSNLLTSNEEVPIGGSDNQTSNLKCRERKLSLDHTLLTRRDCLSQSELDLNSIGKSPLERKSSFFRKKMDSFLKNTTEIFKRQSLGSKPQPIQRKGSMSVSLQSLNENSINNDFSGILLHNSQALQGSVSSLHSSSTVGRSTSSLSASQGLLQPPHTEQGSPLGSGPSLSSSQPLGDINASSEYAGLNDAYAQESLLNSRAISMSSGLDSAHGQRKRKTSRSNRVSWLASEGLTDYFRRVIQDEKGKEIQGCHSYSDFSSIPENDLYGPKVDSKGRRLSYQRAVSGEDPSRYQDSSLKRRHLIPEHSEANYELTNRLNQFTRNGVPSLKGFSFAEISQEAFAYLFLAEKAENLAEFYDWKKLTPNEEARQAVVRELVSTEADHIKHLIAIVEVFIAAAHALQDGGKLLDIDTEKLFLNIPDVLNASLYFWEFTFYPMLVDAAQKATPFNTELMSLGFCHFREILQPYEKFVNEQSKALEYLRSIQSNPDFMLYLKWCHSQKTCNRLQLSDIMVKPMQRLTKYSLILRRIITHTDSEQERSSLLTMETACKNYVVELNRSIRYREEIEKLEALESTIDVYDVDFKDEDMDRSFRVYSPINLRAPMLNSLPYHSRSIIYEGDLRFKDNLKEVDARLILLTDMLLVCKKLSKGSSFKFKMIRPKYMVERMVTMTKYNPRNSKEISALLVVMLDEVGSSYHCFTLTEPGKDANPQTTLKTWEMKIKEAKLTYELGVCVARNPSHDLSEVDFESSSDHVGLKQTSDDLNIEREARERVATMLHRGMGTSLEYDSQASMATDSFDGEGSHTTGSGRTPGPHGHRHLMQRHSTSGSSHNSRLSSFQQSTSAASHDEPQPGPSHNYQAGSSVEHFIPPLNPDDVITSITVNVLSDSESDTVVASASSSTHIDRSPPRLNARSSSASHSTLRVQPQSGVLALVHSLPDLSIEPSPQRPPLMPYPPTASEMLYQSHQELLHQNRLSATQHHQYLSPDSRGTSYPPPSPSRASLKRGLAISYSFKNPPLSKMGHVNSQSQLQAEAGPSTSQQTKNEKGNVTQTPSSSSSEKGDKKSKHISSRHKGGGKDPKGKEEKAE